MFKISSILLWTALGYIAPCFGDGDHTSLESQPNKSRYQTNGAPALNTNDCDKHHFSKYSGLVSSQVGEKVYTGSNPPFPLYEQKIETQSQSSWSGDPRAGQVRWTSVFSGYHQGLHSDVSQNFSILLSHALDCEAKGNKEFLEALKEDLKNRKDSSSFFYSRYSSKEGRYVTDRTEENSPDITQSKQVLELLLAQIDFLENLRKNSPELFSGLKEQLTKNNNPKDGYLSDKLKKAVSEIRDKLKKEGTPLEEFEKLAALAHLVSDSPIFASLLPTDQSAYYRQLLTLGPGTTLAPLKENSKEEQFFESHEQRLSQVLQNAFHGQSASAEFLADDKKRKSSSATDRLSYWDNFESKFAADLVKLKTPEEKNRVRDRVMKGLQELSHGSNWTKNYPPTTSHAQEALIRASRLIEKETQDPIAGRRSEEERQQKGEYSHQIEQLKTSLRRPQDEKSGQVDQILAQAESQLHITIPEDVKNKIRKMDPYLLELFKDNVKSGDLGTTEAFKKFFLTGHSTALFNLKDENIARLLYGRLENLSRNSPLLKYLSSSDKYFLRDGLWAAVKPDSIKTDQWKQNYSEVRSKLVKALEPALSKISNPPEGYKNLPDEAKTLLYSLEMLDSVGNHNVNPYAYWERPETANFYETEKVADRVKSEIELSKNLKQTPNEVEHRISNLLPNGGVHGLPTHARVAQLNRMAQGSESSEQENLKLLADIIGHKGSRSPTPGELDQLKSLAFTNNDPVSLQIALQSRVPELGQLLSTVQEGISGPIDNSKERGAWEDRNKKRSELITSELRKAKTDLIDRLHHTQDDNARRELISALYVLRDFDEKGPEAFLNWLYSSESQDLQDKNTVRTAFPSNDSYEKRFNLDHFMDKLDQLAPKEDEDTTARFKLAQHVDSSFLALAKLKANLGEKDSRVQDLESRLKNQFGEQFETLNRNSETKIAKKSKSEETAKRALLSKYGKDLKWNEEFQAFEIDKNNSAISEDLLNDLETRYPGFKVVLRDTNSGTAEPFHDGKKALKDWIQDRSIDFLNEGLYIGEGQWFPLNEKTAIRLERQQDGSLKPTLGDRVTLERQLKQHIQSTNEAQNTYHKASEEFGSFSHGAEGFFRGLGNFYLLGLVDGPDGSQRSKKLTDTYNKHRGAVEGLRSFGQLGENPNATASQERQNQNNWTKTALRQERENIKKWEENVQLTHDITLFVLSLPVGGIGAQAGKTAISTAERAVLQKAFEKATDSTVRQGLSRLLAKEVITVADATASRQIIGAAAKEFSASTLGRMGLNQFSKTLVSSTKTAGLFSIPLGIGLAAEEIKSATQRSDIESKFKKGIEWRKYPTEPQREDGKSEAQFEKEWLEWYAESQFDRNHDGKPDFLQTELKDVAISGPDRARYAQGFFDTQRTFFEMGMVGQALPKSGMLAHIFGSQLMEQELRILHERGKASDPSQPQTQLGALWDASKGTAHMVPGIVLQRLGMASLPPGLQRNFQLGKLSTNSRELVGMAGFTLGNQSATALAEGKLPNLTDVNTLTGIGMDLYIGRSMAQHANFKLAQEALQKLGAPQAPALEGPGTRGKTSSPQGPRTIEEVAQAYGRENVEFALFNMSPEQLAAAKSPHLLEQATQYFKDRGVQLAEEAKSNPHAKKSYEQLAQEYQTLSQNLKGTGYFRGSSAQRSQQAKELKLLEEALRIKNFENTQAAWNETSGGARMQQSLDGHLSHINSPEAQQKVRTLFQQAGHPELAEALIASGKQSIPKSTQLGQRLSRAYNALDQWTGLPSAIYNLTPPSTTAQHQQANDVLLRSYRESGKNPQLQKDLSSFIGLNRAEAFGDLASREIKTDTDKAVTKMYALHEMARLGVVTRESAKGPVEKTMNEFVDFVTSHSEAAPNKTLKELWNIFENGEPTAPSSGTPQLPAPRKALPAPKESQPSSSSSVSPPQRQSSAQQTRIDFTDINQANKANLNIMGTRNKGTVVQGFDQGPVLENIGEGLSELKWQLGIKKNQQPKEIHVPTVNGRAQKNLTQYVYEIQLANGQKTEVIIMKHEADQDHQFPHWEAGIPKLHTTGQKELRDNFGPRAGQYVYHTANKLRIFFKPN